MNINYIKKMILDDYDHNHKMQKCVDKLKNNLKKLSINYDHNIDFESYKDMNVNHIIFSLFFIKNDVIENYFLYSMHIDNLKTQCSLLYGAYTLRSHLHNNYDSIKPLSIFTINKKIPIFHIKVSDMTKDSIEHIINGKSFPLLIVNIDRKMYNSNYQFNIGSYKNMKS